jgi:DNA-directed RNA polymerase subunit RPC12/RpoP
MNDNERIEAALSEIRGSACVSENVEHWTGTVRGILTRLVEQTRRECAEGCAALSGETVMVCGTDDEIFWSCEVCKAEFAKFPGIRKDYQHCPGCGRRIVDWRR